MNDQPTNSAEHGRWRRRRRRGRTTSAMRERHQADDETLERDEPERAPQAVMPHSSSCTRSPESSALGTKPRAPDVLHERPEVRAVAARGQDHRRRARRSAMIWAHTSKPSVSGSWTSSSTTSRPQPAALRRCAEAPSTASPTTSKPSDSSTMRALRAERRVVVDDEDRYGHVQGDCGRNADAAPIRLAILTASDGLHGRGRPPPGPARRTRPSRRRTGSRPPRAQGPAVLGVDPAVDLERRALADQRAQALELVERAREERLAAPARVHGHAQHEVDVVDHLRARPRPACPGRAPGRRGSPRRGSPRARSGRAASPRRGS